MNPEKTPAKPKAKDYDERIYRKGHPPHRARNALILIGLILIGTYLAVTKSLPFKSEYELHAVFSNAANIRADSPVRIAGVNVGKVKSVRSVGDNADVTFTVSDEGRPIHDDAQVSIRPRIFLEGNFFLDVRTGSPSAPELSDGGTIPITQTSTAVQLDQILTTLQAPDRENLQKLLQGYGNALQHQPTAAEDADQDPDVQGKTAAQATNQSFQYGATAGRDTAIVSEALQGTEPHDLSTLLASSARVFGALSGHEQQLKDLITNFNTTVGALASESDNLAKAVKVLAPTLEIARPSLLHTNQTLPYLRAFARDITPGIRELPDTIAVSQPWLSQTASLLGPDELQPIAHELRLTGPPAGIAAASGPGALSQTELLSRCVSNVLIPTGNVVINDPFSTGVPNYKEFGYAAAAFAGESQSFDANGPYLRFQSGGGTQLLKSAQPGGGNEAETLFGRAPEAVTGSQPITTGSTPPFHTDVPCYLNEIPNLNGPASIAGPPSPAP